MSSYFNVRFHNMSLFVNKWDFIVHLPLELGFEPGRMLGAMLGFMLILRYIIRAWAIYGEWGFMGINYVRISM